MTNTLQRSILLLNLLLVIACSQKQSEPEGESAWTSAAGLNAPAMLENLPENAAGDIVKKSIALSGGWELYQEKQTFSFYKNIQHYDSAGAKVKEVRQLHQYRLRPHFQARLSWQMDGHDFVIVNNGEQAWKFVDGKRSQKQSDIYEAWNTSFGSHYVIFMPFKLADPGVVLHSEGFDTLQHGQIVQVLNITYESGAGSSAEYHKWKYYFDPQSGGLVGNFLDYGSGLSYTEYEEWKEVDGLRMGQRRSVYPVDGKRDLMPMTTVYVNEDMRFDEPLPEELFQPLD
jgi:hypothetical protein